MNIKRIEDYYIEGEKRQYLPYVLECNCPKCNLLVSYNFRQKYLSYPKWGEKHNIWMWCENCEHEWSVQVIPDIVINVLDN